MKLSVILSNLPGAEYTTIDGVRGIFIPEDIGDIVENKGGRMMCVSAYTMPVHRKTKTYDLVGRILLPEKSKDLLLRDPKMTSRNPNIIVGWSGSSRSGGGGVSSDDFDAIAKG